MSSLHLPKTSLSAQPTRWSPPARSGRRFVLMRASPPGRGGDCFTRDPRPVVASCLPANPDPSSQSCPGRHIRHASIQPPRLTPHPPHSPSDTRDHQAIPQPPSLAPTPPSQSCPARHIHHASFCLHAPPTQLVASQSHYPRRITRAISLFASRSAIASRLSYSRLPLASPSSTFAWLRTKYTRKGINV